MIDFIVIESLLLKICWTSCLNSAHLWQNGGLLFWTTLYNLSRPFKTFLNKIWLSPKRHCSPSFILFYIHYNPNIPPQTEWFLSNWIHEYRLWNDLYCVGWGVKLYSIQSNWIVCQLSCSAVFCFVFLFIDFSLFPCDRLNWLLLE